MNKLLITLVGFAVVLVAHSRGTVPPSHSERRGSVRLLPAKVQIERQAQDALPKPHHPSSDNVPPVVATAAPKNDAAEETQVHAPKAPQNLDRDVLFSPYKVTITNQDSPLGRTPKSLQKIKSLAAIKHFDSVPSLRFLSGNFIGAYQRGGSLNVIRLALFFKDDNLDEMSSVSCAGILQRHQTSQSLSGSLQDQTVEFFSMDGKTENQRSLLVVIKDQIVIHAWQVDKRAKKLWAKVYLVQKKGDLLELGYAQLEQAKEIFGSCSSIN